jgi:hypothetical protein
MLVNDLRRFVIWSVYEGYADARNICLLCKYYRMMPGNSGELWCTGHNQTIGYDASINCCICSLFDFNMRRFV